ncbi:hypothetical protein BT69DRAFT_1361226, partial [Atractiella rhizophila]
PNRCGTNRNWHQGHCHFILCGTTLTAPERFHGSNEALQTEISKLKEEHQFRQFRHNPAFQLLGMGLTSIEIPLLKSCTEFC